MELTKATKGKLDFGLSATHALTISVLLLCVGVLLCVPPGCALHRCYKRDQEYRSEFHNYSPYSNYRSQRRPYSRVRASTDDDIPMDDDHGGGDDDDGGTDVGGISLGEFGGSGGGGGSSGDESSTGSINGSKRVDIELTSRNKQVRRL